MSKIYFEEKGEQLLERIGMSKSEFARKMGIQRQNVKSLFTTKNVETIYRAAQVLGVPFGLLVGYTSEPDISQESFQVDQMVDEGWIPSGNTPEDRRIRQQIILSFYQRWKKENPEQKKYNFALNDDINIRSVSVVETAAQASLTYLSTLAVLQLDAILPNAKPIKQVPSKSTSKNQRSFESMLLMEYLIPGMGPIKMTVGIRRSDKMKIQYCITAITATNKKQEAK